MEKRSIINSIIILLIVSIVPITMISIYYTNLNLGLLEQGDTQNEQDHYWNIIPHDEIVYLINDTTTYKGEKISDSLAFWRETIADISDSSIDRDIISDLFIHNEIMLGTDTYNIGIGFANDLNFIFKLFPSLFQALLGVIGEEGYQFIRDNLYDSMYYGNDGFPSAYFSSFVQNITEIPLSIPAGYTLCQSSFWDYLEYILNYLNKTNGDIPYWNYELFDFNDQQGDKYLGTLTYWNKSLDNLIRIDRMLGERDYSHGLNFSVINHNQINKENQNTHLSMSHEIKRMDAFLLKEVAGGEEKLEYPLNLYIHKNQSFIIQMSNKYYKDQDYSFNNLYKDNLTTTLLIENQSLWILEKEHYSTYSGVVVDNYNINGGNWTYIDNFPTDQWVSLNISIDNQLWDWGDVEEGNISISINNGIRYNQTHQFIRSEEVGQAINSRFNPYWLNFAVVDSDIDNTKSYIDDWGDDERFGINNFNEDDPVFNSIFGRDDLTSIIYILTYLNPSTLTILPIDYNFKGLIDYLELAEEGLGISIADFYENEKYMGIIMNKTLIDTLIGLIIGDSDLKIPLVEGAGNIELKWEFRKDNFMMNLLELKISYDNLDSIRTIQIELIKTKTHNLMEEGYNYWYQEPYSIEKTKMYREAEIISRFYNDNVSDVIDSSRYSFDILKLMENVFNEIDSTDLLLKALSQNLPMFIFLILTIETSTIGISYISLKSVKPKR